MNIYTPNQNDIIHETSVDFVLRPCAKEIHIVQYDKSLPIIKVELFRNGERYVLPENAAVNVRVGKLDHTFVYESILGTNEQRNIVYFEVSEQMATIPGRIWPVLEVIENSKVACSSPLCFIIERNPIQEGQIESHDDFPIIYELQGTVADHETRIAALESQVGGDVVTIHTDQYNIDGKKGFTSDIYVDSTGTLSLRFTPTLSSHAVNKGYVDQAIENVEIRSDVIDVLGTHNDLENYDTSDVRLNDLIKVISDETHDNATTYYRWATIEGTNQWDFVALEGPYYTISQVDAIIERIDDDIADVDDRKLELHSFDGFVGGSQVCDQVSNGQIMYCQSGTQSEIDPTQSPIINIELTQEHISAVSNRKAMYIKKIHIEYESDDEPGVNKTWEYTFVSRIFGAGTNQDDINPKVVVLADSTVNPIAVLNTHLELDNYDTSDVESGNIIKVLSDEEYDNATTYYRWNNEWVLIQNIELEWTLIYRPATGKQYFGSYNATKGQQFGSNSNPADYISLYTTSLQNVTVKNVTIEVSGNSGTQAQAKITLVQDVWEYTPAESEESTSSPVITASNESYPFYHGEEGTHLGTGGGTIIQYEHVFLKKENGEVSVIEPNHDYLYIEDNGTNDSYRLYKYVGIQMQEVSKTRLGSASDTAYRGDYGQDNYNKIREVRDQTFTFNGVKTFAEDTYFNSIIYVDHIKSTDEDGGYHTLARYNSDGYYWILENVSIIGQDSLIFMQAEDSNDPGSVVSPLNADSYRIMNLADPINDTDATNKKYVDETKQLISDEYRNTQTYSIGDLVIYNNTLYRCTTAVSTAEDFDSTKWTATSIDAELLNKVDIYSAQTISGIKTLLAPLSFGDQSCKIYRDGNVLKLQVNNVDVLVLGSSSSAFNSILRPNEDNKKDLGQITLRWKDAYIAGKISDGTNSITVAQIVGKYDKPSTGIPASDLADTYVLANTAITGDTKCKITYDAKGLVTAGADLEASDIPSLDASKITSGTFADARIASASTWNAKYDKPSTGIPASDLADLDASKITSGTFDDARIASASTWNAKQNALTFDSTPTQGSSNPVTSGGVYSMCQIIEETAAGKCKSYVIDTQSQITGTKDSEDNYTNVTAITGIVLSNLKVGDQIFIKQLDVPDYWVSALLYNGDVLSSVSLNKMETTKVSITWDNITGTLSKDTRKDLFDKIYPVGSIYLSMNNTNPSNLFGGTWEQINAGYYLISAGTRSGKTYNAGIVGGSNVYTPVGSLSGGKVESHVLTVAEMPSHNHGITWSSDTRKYLKHIGSGGGGSEWVFAKDTSDYQGTWNLTVQYTGSGAGHSHDLTLPTFTGTQATIQPEYFPVYMFKRTAL